MNAPAAVEQDHVQGDAILPTKAPPETIIAGVSNWIGVPFLIIAALFSGAVVFGFM